MKRLLTTALPAVLLAALAAAPQVCAQAAGSARAQADGDLCHVYVVDVLKARRAQAAYRDTGDPGRDTRALAAAQVVFPEFRTVRGEEELTTKSYRFPGSRLLITASVFYTDESMASAAGNDSMLLGVAVSRRVLRDAFDEENNAVAELTSAGADAARVKKYLRVGGRLYLLGLQCNRKPQPGGGR
ncbi:MAG TPA: hypothetical protein VF508_11435 [Pyrinomonadaceae bacterium]|jgi:hypothetical protein